MPLSAPTGAICLSCGTTKPCQNWDKTAKMDKNGVLMSASHTSSVFICSLCCLHSKHVSGEMFRDGHVSGPAARRAKPLQRQVSPSMAHGRHS